MPDGLTTVTGDAQASVSFSHAKRLYFFFTPHFRNNTRTWPAPPAIRLSRSCSRISLRPMDGPVMRGAGVAYADGKILAVGARQDLLGRFSASRIDDLGPAVLMPGLVNAHVHLELSALTPGDRPTSFVEWLKRLIPRGPIDPDVLREFVGRSVRVGVEQSLRFGVTTVGDISRHCAITRPLLQAGPLRVVSFGEIQAMA